jgi:hypothetical protein
MMSAYWHRLGDHRVGTHFGAITHNEATQHFGASANDHIFAQGRMPLCTFVQRCTAQSDPVVDGAAVTNFGCFTNHNAHAMVEKYPLS